MSSSKISIISRMGGKFQLIDNIVPIIIDCASHYDIIGYCETCGGSGKVLFNVPIQTFEYRVYNEINRGFCNFFKVLQDKVELVELMTRLEKLRYSKEVFELAVNELERDKVMNHLSTVDSAVYTYIAVFQSRAANMKQYSPSNEDDLGYYTKISRLKDYYYILEDVEIQNQDCMVLLESYKENENVLVYIDPPYIPSTLRSPETYGDDSWTMEQHQKLVCELLQTKAKVILSGYEDKKYRTYKPLEDNGWTKILLKNVHVSSSVGKSRAEEYVWINFDITQYTLNKVSYATI